MYVCIFPTPEIVHIYENPALINFPVLSNMFPSFSLVAYREDCHRVSSRQFLPEDYCSAGEELVMLNADSEVQGFISFERNPESWFITWVCAKHGLGSDLFQLFEHYAVDNGVQLITLNCVACNAESNSAVLRRINFYCKIGYRFTGIEYETFTELDGFVCIKTCFRMSKAFTQ